jgi:hypothetical protein
MRYAAHGILGFFLILASGGTRADTIESDVQVRKFAEAVMGTVGAGDLDGAFKAMKPYVTIPDAEVDALVVGTKAQRSKAGSRFGKTVGAECVDEKKVGQSLIRVICLEKTEQHALPWMFYFYKTPRGWVLNSFVWNDNVPALFAQ